MPLPIRSTAILAEAAKLCEDTLAPLNRAGDKHPARLENGVVRTSPGFADGYRAIADGGWVGMSASPEHGGMGLPITVATCVNDMMGSACLALQLNPLMTQGQIEALEHHAIRCDQGALYPQTDFGRMVRHDEPDRTAGGVRCGRAAHPGRDQWRWHLCDHRAEDLHHLGRQ